MIILDMTPKEVLQKRQKDIINRATSFEIVYQEYFDGPEMFVKYYQKRNPLL